jgi:hypothetical protein
MVEEENSVSGSTVIGYEQALEEITQAIDRSESGAPSHIAIVAEPMSGRTTIVAEIKRLYGNRVHYRPLEFIVTPADFPDFSAVTGDIILIDNCQFLATRVIGGFDILDTFLRMQILSKKIFITTWNAYSWQYLSAVTNLDEYFPTTILLTRVDTPVLKQIIMSRYKPGEIRFLDGGTSDRSMFFSIIHLKMRLPFTTTKILVPWVKLNFTVMLHKLSRTKRVQVSLEDVIFEKINRTAQGNPGVAMLLWDKSLKDNTISLNAINETPYSISLDTNESYILSVILSMECLHKKDLVAMAGSEMDIGQVLYRLVQQGLVMNNAGCYSIVLSALVPVTDYLKKTRRVW